MKSFRPARWFHYLFFTVGLCLMGYVFEYHKIVFYKPQSTHQWRQSDSASYALNYAADKLPIWEPRTHTLTGKEGRAVSELPITYYAASLLYRAFGPNECWLRGLHVCIFWLGLLAFFGLGARVIGNVWLAILPPAFIFTSPYVAYYANNFLVNVPALSITLMAWHGFFRYLFDRRIRWLYMAFGLIAIASMLKIPAVFSLGAMSFLLVVVLPRQASWHKRRVWQAVGLSVGALASIGVWIVWARYYNRINGTGQNLLSVIPIWNMGWADIKATAKITLGWWRRHYIYGPMAVLLLGMAGYWLAYLRRSNLTLNWIVGLLAAGFLLYMLLWFEAFYVHDYYLLHVVIVPAFLILAFLRLINSRYHLHRHWVWCMGVVVLLVAVLSRHTRQMQHVRYYGEMYESCNQNLWHIEPFLESVGIGRDDKVVSVPDVSPNITLYAMNRYGWSEAFTSDSYNIHYFVSQGAKYLIVNDSAYLEKPLYKPFLNRPVAQFRDVFIFRID